MFRGLLTNCNHPGACLLYTNCISLCALRSICLDIMRGIVAWAGDQDNDFTKGHSAIIISTVHSGSLSGSVFSVFFSLITVAAGVRMLLSSQPAISVVFNITTKAFILMVPDIKPSLFRDTCTFRRRRVHCYRGKALKPPLLLIASLGCNT